MGNDVAIAQKTKSERDLAKEWVKPIPSNDPEVLSRRRSLIGSKNPYKSIAQFSYNTESRWAQDGQKVELKLIPCPAVATTIPNNVIKGPILTPSSLTTRETEDLLSSTVNRTDAILPEFAKQYEITFENVASVSIKQLNQMIRGERTKALIFIEGTPAQIKKAKAVIAKGLDGGYDISDPRMLDEKDKYESKILERYEKTVKLRMKDALGKYSKDPKYWDPDYEGGVFTLAPLLFYFSPYNTNMYEPTEKPPAPKPAPEIKRGLSDSKELENITMRTKLEDIFRRLKEEYQIIFDEPLPKEEEEGIKKRIKEEVNKKPSAFTDQIVNIFTKEWSVPKFMAVEVAAAGIKTAPAKSAAEKIGEKALTEEDNKEIIKWTERLIEADVKSKPEIKVWWNGGTDEAGQRLEPARKSSQKQLLNDSIYLIYYEKAKAAFWQSRAEE